MEYRYRLAKVAQSAVSSKIKICRWVKLIESSCHVSFADVVASTYKFASALFPY